MKKLFTLVLAVFVLASVEAKSEERVLGFHSDIEIYQDSSMTVREHITVRAEGRRIRRGIYRDFPTTYKDRLGNRYKVGFEMVSVVRNGQREDYHTKSISNGIRIYFGNKNRLVNTGEHTYVLTYRTSRQLGFFEKHDELYWNVTGNGWDFRIESASASVRLPRSIDSNSVIFEAYTGQQGSKGQDYEAGISDDGRAQFVTTRALGAREGLTIVTGWPKGHVRQPSLEDKAKYLVKDNRHLLFMLAGAGLLLVYYTLIWVHVGRDQPQGVIMPLYYPPKGYSPASMRFVRERGYDHKTFATALVNLAVKGLIAIDEKDGDFTIERTYDVNKKGIAPTVEKAPGEHALLKKLLGSRKSIVLEQSNHPTISKAIDAHKKSLKRNYEKIYFAKNSGWVVPGVLLSLAAIFTGVLMSPFKEGAPAIFMIIWLSVWSAVVYFLVVRAVRAFKGAKGPGGWASFLHALLFASVFGFFEVMAIFMFLQFTSLSVILILLFIVAINVVFYHLLHADTRAGRRLLDKIEGLRLYLDVAESDELKMKGAPTKTTDLFEMYLPYALALDVEQRWAERFADVFASLERNGESYQPGWYHGHHWHMHHPARFTDSIGSSLSSAISSSSTAPGSSSGGGGGGFSGGGGGGGGGGGW